MGKQKNSDFNSTLFMNQMTYTHHLKNLINLGITMFNWKNIPPTIDVRLLELNLLGQGMCVFFKDDALGYLCLPCAMGGKLDVYNIPTERRVYAPNGYQNVLNNEDSVVIFDNYLHTPSLIDLQLFAERIYEVERTIDVNIKAQKTPIVITCDENERLSLKNLMMKYEGNTPFIYGSKSFDTNSIKVLNTQAPYVADKLATTKADIWGEALTFLGIPNVSFQKRERLITDEVTNEQGGVLANRVVRLQPRKEACEKINEMFGLNIDVEYNAGVEEMVGNIADTKEGVVNG